MATKQHGPDRQRISQIFGDAEVGDLPLQQNPSKSYHQNSCFFVISSSASTAVAIVNVQNDLSSVHLHRSARVDKDVPKLDVSVHHVVEMQDFEALQVSNVMILCSIENEGESFASRICIRMSALPARARVCLQELVFAGKLSSKPADLPELL